MERRYPELAEQHGLATRQQLLAAGWSPSAIHHLAAATGRQVLPCVYARHRGPLSPDAQLVAGWLWAGAGSVLTGAAALARFGVALPRPPELRRYLVPASARARASGVFLTVRTTRTGASRTLAGVPTATVERSLADAARHREYPPDQLHALTLAVLQERRSTPERLTAELRAYRSGGSGAIGLGVEDFVSGPWSVPEVWLRRAVAGHKGLPPLLMNPRLSTPGGVLIGVPDGYLPAAAVAIQVHSRAFHAGVDEHGRDRWSATVEADARYTRHGILVVAVTPMTLRYEPDRFLGTLVDVVAAQGARPLPDVRITSGP